jgi:hypothetical protein
MFAAGLVSPVASQGTLYGPALAGDALANTTIGPGGNEVSLRFKAEPGGVLRAVRPFLIWSFRKAGYHGGTGGILKVELQTDDGTPDHRPSGQVLAASVQRLYLVPASDQFYPLLTFDRAPNLAPGALYHLVFSNPHPQRDVNYLSVNALFTKVADDPRQPGRRDEDWGMLFRNQSRPKWSVRRTPGTSEGFTPILEITCDRGSQGIGYMECWMGAPEPISGPASVREVFTVTGPSFLAGSVAVRVRRLAGSEPLRVRLEQAGATGGAVEGTCTGLPQATVSGSLGGCAWVVCTFPAPVVLARGRTYHLVLAAPASSRYEAFPLRKGSDKGFTAASVFEDGHAEFTAGTGWQGWQQWGQKGRLDGDLQFYFQRSAAAGNGPSGSPP